MRCSRCNKESDNFILGLDADSGEKVQLCYECYNSQNMPEFASLEELDEENQEIHNLLKKIESFEAYHAEREKKDAVSSEGISPFSLTPGKIRIMMETREEQVKREREKLLAAMSADEIIKYRLRRAIALEDFEEAARLKAELEQLERG